VLSFCAGALLGALLGVGLMVLLTMAKYSDLIREVDELRRTMRRMKEESETNEARV